ncbi:MAG: hypothetical protein ACYTHJ_18490 [Planctomycetota bacterium]
MNERTYRSWLPRPGTLWALVSSLLLAAGCSKDMLVYENFNMIDKNHTSRTEVANLIGEPDSKMGNQWMYERPSKHLCAFIDFNEKGLVCRKQWIDGMNNVWEDSQEAGGGWENNHPD